MLERLYRAAMELFLGKIPDGEEPALFWWCMKCSDIVASGTVHLAPGGGFVHRNCGGECTQGMRQ